jgi:hypothetical protein
MQKKARQVLSDGTFIEWVVSSIKADKWRPHGKKYRLAWIQNRKCRVLFDNHSGKGDHFHLDGVEYEYKFTTLKKLREDFLTEIRKLKGKI